MMRMLGTRRSGISAALLGLALVGAACGGGPASTDDGLFFPTTKFEQGGAVSMLAKYSGPLVVRDGCVLIGHPGEYLLPLWWKGFSAERDPSGHVVVRDDSGATVAIEGQDFTMGGGLTAEFDPTNKVEQGSTQVQRLEKWLGYPIPERCLPSEVHGVWAVGDTHPLASSGSRTSEVELQIP